MLITNFEWTIQYQEFSSLEEFSSPLKKGYRTIPPCYINHIYGNNTLQRTDEIHGIFQGYSPYQDQEVGAFSYAIFHIQS